MVPHLEQVRLLIGRFARVVGREARRAGRGRLASPRFTGPHPGPVTSGAVRYGSKSPEGDAMAARQGKKKMGRVARRMARIERRTIRLLLIPVVIVAQRRMMKSLERVA
jgi:hypothetical protein